MRILLVVRTNGVFKPKKDYVKYLIKELLDRKFRVSIYDPKKRQLMDYNNKKIKSILLDKKIKIKFLIFFINIISLGKVLKVANDNFDCVHFLNIRFELLFLINRLKKYNGQKIGTIYGGEVFLNPIRRLFGRIYAAFDVLTVQNNNLKKIICDLYPGVKSSKIIVRQFPIISLDIIDNLNKSKTKKEIRDKYNIKLDELVIQCCTNGNENENHNLVIDALLQSLVLKHSNRIVLLFFLTYDSPIDYRLKLKKKIETLLADYKLKIFIDYLDIKSVAELKIITDLFINVRNTDQFNSGMVESIYAQSAIITGDWLPYNDLIDTGFDFIQTDKNYKSLANKIYRVIIGDKFDLSENKKIMYDISHPRVVLSKFIEIYNL